MSDPSEPSSRISCGAKRDLDDRSVEGADRVRKTRRHDEGVQDSKEPREHKKSSKKHKHERKEKKEKKDKKSKKKKEKKLKSERRRSSSTSGTDDSSSSGSPGAPRSIITGKKIKMSRDVTAQDRLLEMERAAKRHSMNSQF